ncbi:MAG: GlsB/YeaQ/YmgE family stress response membrane protein [Candidatus Competibacter denitrificans]
MELIGFLLIGLAAGWIATQFMRGGSMGLVGNLVIGVVGAFVGGFLFRLIGFAAVGLIGHLITATVGAVVLLYAVGVLKKS